MKPIEFEPASQDNKRSAPRARFTYPVQYEELEINVAGGSVGFDISEGGIRIKFNEYVPVGTVVNLYIHLKDGIIQCSGRIRWMKKYPYSDHFQAGLQFESAENFFDSRTKINNYVKALSAVKDSLKGEL